MNLLCFKTLFTFILVFPDFGKFQVEPLVSQDVTADTPRSEFISDLLLQAPTPDDDGFGFQNGGNVFQTPKRLRMSESCLACLCAASTNCLLTTGCVGLNDQYCGPFLISKPYWLDAGRPVLLGDSSDRDGAFKDCAMDPICSAQTVRRYMTRFQKDCNGNGEVDCQDLARIHLMGPFGSECASPQVPTTNFYIKFKNCWDTVLRLSSTSTSH